MSKDYDVTATDGPVLIIGGPGNDKYTVTPQIAAATENTLRGPITLNGRQGSDSYLKNLTFIMLLFH